MRIVLDQVSILNKHFSLSAHGEFGEGIHLVTGIVGSGKSTLALILAGLTSPHGGSIGRIGISSVMLSMQFPEYHITGFTLKDECASWGLDPLLVLRKAGFSGQEDVPPLSLSRGELKRLHLACVLSGKYDLLILDEPFSALDCSQKEALCRELSLRSGVITIIFSHEKTILPRVDHLWEMSDGTLVDLGTPAHAIARWRNASSLIKKVIAEGGMPPDCSVEDLMEAQCRMQE